VVSLDVTFATLKDDDANSGVSHFGHLLSLAERLASQSVALYYHEWHFDAFGSWSIVAGRRHRRFRFVWDGKEFSIHVDSCYKTSGGYPEQWTAVAEEHLGAGDLLAPVSYIERFFKSHQNI
jgi:hypothetical protein